MAALVSDAFGGPLAGDRWVGFYGIHVRQLTLPQEGELGPDDTPVDQLREVDFLIFDRQRGFAVLEVKGGLLRMVKGEWQRYGWPDDAGRKDAAQPGTAAERVAKAWVPAEDPMAQARSAMNNLLRRLKERLGAHAFKGNPLWHSYAVLMPDVDSTRGGLPPDWNKFVMATQEHLTHPTAFESWLESHFSYTAESYGKRPSDRVTKLVARVINDCIMPPFAGERTARRQVLRLAESDLRAMDGSTPIHEFVHSKIRRDSVLIEGAAGTGKTHAAVLRAMHELETNEGTTVLYVCFNKLLAQQVATGPASRYGDRFVALPFRDLGKRQCERAGIPWPEDERTGDALTEFFRSEAPALLQQAIAAGGPITGPSMVIIDEAQDFNEEWMRAVEAFTGRECIRWCLYDPAQLLFGNLALSTGGRGPDDTADDLSNRLAKRFGRPDLMLRNQRLSARVFEYLRSNGIIPHANTMLDPNALEGFEPTRVEVAPGDALRAIHDAILHAIDGLQFAPDQILVQAGITPANAEHPLFRPKGPWEGPGHDPWDVAGRFRLARIEDGDSIPDDAIEMATAQKFKGCERPYSIVVRTEQMTPPRFYTACTRARLGLAIIDVVT